MGWDLNSPGAGVEDTTVGYFVYVLSSSDVQLQKLNVGNVGTNTITGLAQNTTYHLHCTAYNNLGLESDPSNVLVYNTVQGTPVVTFTAAPATITSGQSSTLSWTTLNATGTSISASSGTQPGTVLPVAQGFINVSPTSTTSYTIRATNSISADFAQLSVTVTVTIPPPPPPTYPPVPTNLQLATPSTNTALTHLQWASVSDPFVTKYFLYAGNLPTSTNNYIARLSVSAKVGATQDAYINVPNGYLSFWVTSSYATGPESQPSSPISTTIPVVFSCFLVVNPSAIIIGDSADLVWSTTGAPSGGTITPGIGSVSPYAGLELVTPTNTTTYVFTAWNAVYTNTCSVTLTVSPPLGITLSASPSTVLSNSTTTLSWISSGPCVRVTVPGVVTNAQCTAVSNPLTVTTNITYSAIAYDINGDSITNNVDVVAVQPPAPPVPPAVPGLAFAHRKAILIR